jgi:D-alanyl-D-alanine carboxypeptidase
MTTAACMIPVLLAAVAGQGSSTGPADAASRASAIVDSLAAPDGPGVQYILVDKDRILFRRSAGLADIGARLPLTDESVMAAFSMTKTVTAIAVLQLFEAGKLALDDRVAQYIKHPYHRETTVRQLLAHTGGIPNPLPLRWVHLAEDDGSFHESTALHDVLRRHGKPSRRPGRKYAYANIGYWLLGKVVEAASGRDYVPYVTEHIFLPLGLRSAEIGFCASATGRRAKGYLARYSFLYMAKGFVTDKAVWGGAEGAWLQIRDVCVNGPAFGGAFGTAAAFGRVLQDLLSDRPLLLGTSGKELLFTRERTSSGKPIAMTPGWHIGELNGERYFFKEGGGAGFRSEMRIYPGAGLGSVIMTNRTSFDTRKGLAEVDSLFLQQRP